jgi:hypothetical protein
MTRTRPPIWFWIVIALLILWGLSGVFGFYMSVSSSARAQMSAYDRSLYENAPGWYMPVYAVAVWAGLGGSVLLALRRRLAQPFYVASFVAVVVMFGWTFAATDLIAVKGVATAVTFPILIGLLCVFEIWLARRAERRGWIG